MKRDPMNVGGLFEKDEKSPDEFYFDRCGCLQHAPRSVEATGKITSEARKETGG